MISLQVLKQKYGKQMTSLIPSRNPKLILRKKKEKKKKPLGVSETVTCLKSQRKKMPQPQQLQRRMVVEGFQARNPYLRHRSKCLMPIADYSERTWGKNQELSNLRWTRPESETFLGDYWKLICTRKMIFGWIFETVQFNKIGLSPTLTADVIYPQTKPSKKFPRKCGFSSSPLSVPTHARCWNKRKTRLQQIRTLISHG